MLVGPYLTYASYTSLVDESLFKSVESPRPTRRAVPDGRKRVAYRKMLVGLIFLGLFVVLGPSYNFTTALTPWFAQQGFFYQYVTPRVDDVFLNLLRIIIFQFFGFVERCKYYAIWTLTEVGDQLMLVPDHLIFCCREQASLLDLVSLDLGLLASPFGRVLRTSKYRILS